MSTRPELSFDSCGINGPDEYRTRIATFNLARLTPEQVQHYGRLFEVAPELLKALRGCLAFLEGVHGGYPESTASRAAKPCMDAARTAIAKVEGRA